MSDEPEKKPSSGIGEGLTLQGFGNGVAACYVLWRASLGHYFPPAFEIALGAVLGGIFYAGWKLFGRRIMKWARGG